MNLASVLSSNMQEARDLSFAFSDSMIDLLINALTARAPHENRWVTRIRNVIMNEIAPNDLRARIRFGLESIAVDLLANLGKNRVFPLLQQWLAGVKKLKNKTVEQLGREKEEWGYVTPQELMNISNSVINEFYESGRRYYLSKDFSRASDVFLLVVILDFLRPNSWLALGLSEEHQCKWSEALYAFGVSSLLKYDAPAPHIHAAECYLALNEIEDAKASLILANEAIIRNPSEASHKLEHYIKNLRMRCQ